MLMLMLINPQLRDINLKASKTTYRCTRFGRTLVARNHSKPFVIPLSFASAFGIDLVALFLDLPSRRRILFREPMTQFWNIGSLGKAVLLSFLGCFSKSIRDLHRSYDLY